MLFRSVSGERPSYNAHLQQWQKSQQVKTSQQVWMSLKDCAYMTPKTACIDQGLVILPRDGRFIFFHVCENISPRTCFHVQCFTRTGCFQSELWIMRIYIIFLLCQYSHSAVNESRILKCKLLTLGRRTHIYIYKVFLLLISNC